MMPAVLLFVSFFLPSFFFFVYRYVTERVLEKQIIGGEGGCSAAAGAGAGLSVRCKTWSRSVTAKRPPVSADTF